MISGLITCPRLRKEISNITILSVRINESERCTLSALKQSFTHCNGSKISDLYSGMHLYTKRLDFSEVKKRAFWTHFWCMHHCLGFVYRCMHHNAGEYGINIIWRIMHSKRYKEKYPMVPPF